MKNDRLLHLRLEPGEIELEGRQISPKWYTIYNTLRVTSRTCVVELRIVVLGAVAGRKGHAPAVGAVHGAAIPGNFSSFDKADDSDEQTGQMSSWTSSCSCSSISCEQILQKHQVHQTCMLQDTILIIDLN